MRLSEAITALTSSCRSYRLNLSTSSKRCKPTCQAKKYKKSKQKFCLNENLAVSLQPQRRKIHGSGNFLLERKRILKSQLKSAKFQNTVTDGRMSPGWIMSKKHILRVGHSELSQGFAEPQLQVRLAPRFLTKNRLCLGAAG